MKTQPKQYEYPDGTKSWRLNGRLHREDGPAYEGITGHKEWWLNGKRHRLDGPAVEYPNGYKAWFLNGKQYTEEEFVMVQFMNGNNIYRK